MKKTLLLLLFLFTNLFYAQVSDLPMVITSNVVNISCHGSIDGSIDLTIKGGSGSYLYKLNGGVYQTGNVNMHIINLPAGTHLITVRDKTTGYEEVVVANITEPNILLATVAIKNQTLTIDATGGNAIYRYSLDGINFQDSNVFTNITEGVYEAYVRDSKGCIVRQTATNSASILVASASVSPITCTNPNGIITINATGGTGSYQYSLDNGITFTSQNVFTGLAAGTYKIAVKDAQNNLASISITVIVTSSPVITAAKM